MSSDSDRKAAEEYAERIVGHDIDSLRYAMRDPIANARADFLAGYEYALKDLEQIAREAYEQGGKDALENYWQKKTESKEGE